MSTPTFTVICPAFNRGEALSATIRSVVEQERSDWELLVVSDGSTDDTDDVIRRWAAADDRVRPLRTPGNRHPGAARNLGLRLARGALVAYIDHDDEYGPCHLDEVAALLDGAPWAVTGARYHDHAGGSAGETTALDACWSPTMQQCGPLFEPTRVGHHRGVVEGIGGWTTRRRGLEDWDLWSRLAAAGLAPAITTSRTVSLLRDGTTRRHQLETQFLHVLAPAGDLGVAEAALQALVEPPGRERWARAVAADLAAWLAREDAVGTLVRGVGAPAEPWRLVPPRLDTGVDALVAAGGTGSAAVAVPLPCVRAEHARWASEILERVAPRQHAVVRSLVADSTRSPSRPELTW